ncbi:type VI secretion system-associated FHA domain protein TagH [Roseibium sp. HPY-6]|uniref:type VI secretion system-associated FHA domain protein TagH n=1 Tax=Roseibium sp. HPY-6 TaxID=3229852 RepID=UPI00338DA773
MRITLQIENVDRLETGGQVSYSCADRGFDIGRHEHLDWSLPDPERVVSGKHCEVRFEGGNFVLYDVSTNGTFLNGSPNRMDKAHALRSGDRIMIGDYIVKVTLDAEQAMGAGFSGASPGEPQAQPAPWQSPQPSAPPVQEPQWPGASTPGQPAYPVEEANNPWNTPSTGMEGRHAPPSQAPGIGTPADDVWSQQGHGWGSADPALYDPQSNTPQAEAARPAQADPLDHLAPQPNLQPQDQQIAYPQAPQPAPPQPQAFPGGHQEAASNQAAEPLFKMPDMAAEEAAGTDEGALQAVNTSSAPVAQTDAGAAASPFPEAPARESVPADVEPKIETSPAEPAQAAVEAPVQPPQAVSEASKPQAVESTPKQETAAGNNGTDFLKAFSEGAGIPASVLADRDPEEFAREMGSILQGITSDLMGLLQARSKVKAMTRNANRTLISRSGNNALKFSPTPQTALQTMLAQNVEETGYLPLPKAMTAAFKDIQKHHVWTYAAMQKAAARFDETLSPKAIEEEGQVAKSTFGNQKAKLWERMQERWTSLSGAYDDGLVGVFTQYFTESYEEFSNDEPE